MNNGATLEPETWVDQHGDSLFRFAVLRVHDPETASDLVQETFLEALRARETFSGRSSVRTWLVAILKHKIVDRLRKLGREHRFHESAAPENETMFDRHGHWRSPPLDWDSDPLREYERREFWEVIGQCLTKIPPHLADASLDRELEGLSREAICRDVNITPENLSVRLYRARLCLRHCPGVHWFHGRTAMSEGRRALTWTSSRGQLPQRGVDPTVTLVGLPRIELPGTEGRGDRPRVDRRAPGGTVLTPEKHHPPARSRLSDANSIEYPSDRTIPL